MPLISVDYEYNLPNEYLVDHNQDLGNKRSTTYDGPDKLYLIVNNETGKEEVGPITAEEKADGRPLPLGCRYVEVDCIENPLICQLRAPVIDEVEEDHEEGVLHRLAPHVDGYPDFNYQIPLLPKNVFDKLDLTIDPDDTIHLRIKTIAEGLYGRDIPLPTWDDIRKKRNYELKHTDGMISEDMPDHIKAEWIEYRQLLRDLPDALAHIPAHFAIKMFPDNPDAKVPPTNPFA